MMHYSVQPGDRIFVKGYGYFSFANIGKNISRNFSGKCSQKLFDDAKQSATYAFKTALKKEQFQKQQKQLLIWLVIKLLTQ